MHQNSKNLEQTNNKLDILLIILLTKYGFRKKEIAKILKISDHTIDRILPYNLLKKITKLENQINR